MRDRKPTVRVTQNPVTHQMESVVLDDVQLAFERIVAAVDGAILRLGTADRDRLARRLIDRVGQMATPEAAP